MQKIILTVFTALLILSSSLHAEDAEDNEIVPKLVVGKTLADITLNDQFEKPHTFYAETKKVIFAFSKNSAHTCNDYFDKKKPTYLADNHVQYVADISSAPFIIKFLFVMPSIKDLKHAVLLLDNEEVAASFKTGIDSQKIVIVTLNNKKITNIKTITTEDELTKEIQSN